MSNLHRWRQNSKANDSGRYGPLTNDIKNTGQVLMREYDLGVTEKISILMADRTDDLFTRGAPPGAAATVTYPEQQQVPPHELCSGNRLPELKDDLYSAGSYICRSRLSYK